MKKLKFLLIFILGFISLSFADETLTITTYYPSPYGSYQDLYVANTLGIGITTPLYSLHIAKNAAASGALGTAPAVLMLEQANNTNWSGGEAAAEILFKKGGDIVGAIRSLHTRAGGPHSAEDAGLAFYVAPSAETPVAFEAMRIDSLGNVGIGTTSPGVRLDVIGSIQSRLASSGNVGGILLGTTASERPVIEFHVSDNSVRSKIEFNDINTANERIGFFMSPVGTLTEFMSLNKNGFVGIGTTAPTVQFERVCPAGFTNVKAGNNQLGCMQTAEQGTATWDDAANACFTNYGGRLPTTDEWYVTMANYALTGETDDNEWNSDTSTWQDNNRHSLSGGGSITYQSGDPDSNSHSFRCWIPK